MADIDAAKQLPRLGAGWQYHAYDLGDGRVLKVPISRSALIHIALERRRNDPAYSPEQAAAWAAAVVSGVQRSYRVLENVLPHLDARLLGNPELLGHGVYEQDKLLMIGDYISHHTFPENAAIIDRYVDTTLELWQWGISEVVFNFTINSGIDRDGGVALCDLGEITAVKGDVQRMVSDQVWLRRASYNSLPDKRLQAYARTTMAERLTAIRVEATWGRLRQDR